mgnify:CR=1 FL=1
MTDGNAPLKHLMPGWFAIVMGWCGLALAWHRAVPLMGELAGTAALLAGGVALLAFAALMGLSLLRASRHAVALADDLKHPVRHVYVAAVPTSWLLLVTLGVDLAGPSPVLGGLWGVGAVAHFGVTAWVLARWLRGTPAAGTAAFNWAAVTPALLIAVVGNLLVPLAGVPLGFAPWSTAQFGVGLLFWPVVLTLFVVRLGTAGALPERMLPTVFLFIAPPAVGGLAVLQLGAPMPLAWGLWGVALFSAAWVASLARRIAELPFGIPHWALGFALAALAMLTLRLAATPEGAWLVVPAMGLLALASLVILGLSLATVRGLRAGALLVPEAPPVITLKPAG